MSNCELETASAASPPEIKFCPVCGAEAERTETGARCSESERVFWVDY